MSDTFFYVRAPRNKYHGMKVKHIRDLRNYESECETIDGERFIIHDNYLYYDIGVDNP